MIRLGLAMLVAGVLLGACATPAPPLMPPAGFQRSAPAKVQLIYVGGNSQHCDGNARQLLGHWRTVADDIAGALAIGVEEINRHYYSWTGDTFDQGAGCVPNPFQDIWEGQRRMLTHLDALETFDDPTQLIVIVGYSNGGATAFDLADALCARGQHVSLLITLDPVSRLGPRAEHLGAQTWLNVFIEAHSLIIFSGRPWRGNAPESSLNRLVLDARHRHVDRMWAEVARSDQFAAWGAAARRGLGVAPATAPTCRRIGSRDPRRYRDDEDDN